MTRKLFTALLLMLAVSLSSSAKSVSEYLQTMPDSICPLAIASTADTITDSYLHIRLSDVSDLELRTLTTEGADTLLCVVQTFKAPLAESDVRIYDAQWKEQQHLTFTLADVIGEDAARKYRTFFDPLLIAAHLNANSEEITLKLSHSNLSEEEKKELEGLKLQTSLNWNKETFK